MTVSTVPPDPMAVADQPEARDLSCLSTSDREMMSEWQEEFCPDVEEEMFWDSENEEWWSRLYPKGTPSQRSRPYGNTDDSVSDETVSGDDSSEDPSDSGEGGGSSGSGSGVGGGSSGGNLGSGISWQPGGPGTQCTPLSGSATQRRDLGPLSLKGGGRCGTSCDKNWYCDWWNNGIPPWFYDPSDPVCLFSPCSSFFLFPLPRRSSFGKEEAS